MGQWLATMIHRLKPVDELEVLFVCLFVLAISQWWVLPLKMVNKYKTSLGFASWFTKPEVTYYPAF